MVCRSCGANVGESDRFCNACGARLTPQDAAPTTTDSTLESPADAGGEESSPVAPEAPGPEPLMSPPDPGQTSVNLATPAPSPPPKPAADPAAPPPAEPPPEHKPVSTLGVDASSTAAPGDDRDRTNEMPAPSLYDLADETDADVTSQLAAMASRRTGETVTPPPPSTTPPAPPDVTDRTGVTTPAAAPSPDVTTAMATTRAPTTGEVPASYTPYKAADDRYTYSAADARPHRFHFRVMLIFAILAAGAGACAAVTNVVEITTDAGAPLPEAGTWMINDFGTNTTVAMAIAGGVMVLGALLGCFGFRWGGGLAGGAGLAMAGWSALMIGLAEEPLARVDSVLSSPELRESFRVTLTRDIGYGLIAAAGVLGLVAFVTSLASVRRDRATNLNPWVAALGAAATLVAAAGPLLPVNGASIESNWTSTGWIQDEPTLFFVGRLVQVGLVAVAGMVGFLLVRRYGLGLAAGGFTVFVWLATTALLEQTENPIGPAEMNPIAEPGDTIPHAVTIGGLAVALFCLLVAAFEVALSRTPDS